MGEGELIFLIFLIVKKLEQEVDMVLFVCVCGVFFCFFLFSVLFAGRWCQTDAGSDDGRRRRGAGGD
jgi:hypothetical protein